jgi:RNA polymerase III subunit Rpc25
VFRPFKGEILQAVILENSPTGIRLSMDFFADIWVPAANLQAPSVFKVQDGEKVWIWDPEAEKDDLDGMDVDEAEKPIPYYYDQNEPVRFRVEAEVWNDHSPQKPPGEEDDDDEDMEPAIKREDGGSSFAVDEDGKRIKIKDVPYTIIVSLILSSLTF